LSDAVLAVAAREQLWPGEVRAIERGVLARATLESLWATTRAKGPPSDEELAQATERRWWELDRPELRRTSHAIVRTGPGASERAARDLADRIARAVATATGPEAFRKAAEEVPRDGFEVKVEDLQPCAADGRTVDPAAPPPPGSQVGRYAEDFVSAAYAIASPGEKSPVVRTSFGYHVILLVERIPEKRVSAEERRALLGTEILERRARALREALLTELGARHPIETARASDELMELVKVAE
jgi:peptidyl-prolyl cis-trans isomerase C